MTDLILKMVVLFLLLTIPPKILLLLFIIGLLGARPFTPAWPPIGFSNIFVENPIVGAEPV